MVRSAILQEYQDQVWIGSGNTTAGTVNSTITVEESGNICDAGKLGHLAFLLLFELMINDNDPNAYFFNFRNLFSQTIDKHAPRRPITRREQFSKRKPWTTNGLLTSVKTKVCLLKRFVKFKTSESYNKYKRYRSLLNRVVKQAKIRYYHLAINNSRGNSGELWKVIRKLIQSRKPKQTASTLIENSNYEMESAEFLNNYFVNIGENLAKKITVPDINHSHNNQDYCPNSFFLSPTNAEEVEAIIKTLKIKKQLYQGTLTLNLLNWLVQSSLQLLVIYLTYVLKQGYSPTI